MADYIVDTVGKEIAAVVDEVCFALARHDIHCHRRGSPAI
jgi:hypothetical protein